MALVVRNRNKETGEYESIDSMLRRFKKQVKQDGTLETLQERRFFKPKSLARREKSLRAAIRDRKFKKD